MVSSISDSVRPGARVGGQASGFNQELNRTAAQRRIKPSSGGDDALHDLVRNSRPKTGPMAAASGIVYLGPWKTFRLNFNFGQPGPEVKL